MSLSATIFNNAVAILEALTPKRKYAESARFRHASTCYDPETLRKSKGCTRQFIYRDTFARGVGVPQQVSTDAEWTYLVASHELFTFHLQGTDAAEFNCAVGEDVDQIKRALDVASGYPTGLQSRVATPINLDLEGAAGGVAVLQWSVECVYRPD